MYTFILSIHWLYLTVFRSRDPLSTCLSFITYSLKKSRRQWGVESVYLAHNSTIQLCTIVLINSIGTFCLSTFLPQMSSFYIKEFLFCLSDFLYIYLLVVFTSFLICQQRSYGLLVLVLVLRVLFHAEKQTNFFRQYFFCQEQIVLK